MHIGIDARLTYYRAGGISTYIRRLIQALEALDTANRYTVFHSRKARESLVERFRSAKLWTPSHHRLERLALSVELARYRLDVLHSPDFIPPLRGARRHVITVHDLNFLYYPQFLTAESRRYYDGQIVKAVEQADHILADSEATKVDLVEMLNVPLEKITVHMLGVEPHFKPLPAEEHDFWRTKLDLPAQYFLYFGTFEPRKNIIGLLQAYRLLIDRRAGTPPLVLAGGRGWLFDATMARIDELKLGARVIWKENIAYEALPALYSLATALVMPSFYEGFGLPALEAMACGTVPIVSNRASLPEVVGAVGLQVDPDDDDALAAAMKKVLNNTRWVARMRAAGLERAKMFTWERTANTVLSVYRTLH